MILKTNEEVLLGGCFLFHRQHLQFAFVVEPYLNVVPLGHYNNYVYVCLSVSELAHNAILFRRKETIALRLLLCGARFTPGRAHGSTCALPT